MKYKIGGYLLFFCAIVFNAYAQDTTKNEDIKGKVTLSGTIVNEFSNETLIGATIVIPEANISLLTNTYGFYSITLPQGDYTIIISYMGFDDVEEKISLSQNTKRDFVMHEN